MTGTARTEDLAAEEPALVIERPGMRSFVPVAADGVVLGRGGQCDVVVAEPLVSRLHARVLRVGGRFVLEDPGSRHGTFANGMRVTRHTLAMGDRIRLGGAFDWRFTFTRHDEPAPTPPLCGLERSSRRSLELLLDVYAVLPLSLDLDAVLGIIMDSAITLTAAERGYLMLREPDGSFRVRVARAMGRDAEKGAAVVSRTVVDRCLELRRPVILDRSSPGTVTSLSSSLRLAAWTRVISVPLVVKGEVIGALYLCTNGATQPVDESPDVVLMAFASQAAVSLQNARLYQLATRDGLTGLALRGHFEACLREALAAPEHAGAALSLLMLDVDHFKRVNDRHGHLAGDDVLREVASLLAREARGTDIVGRYGGEEFVILAPTTDGAAAVALGRRIRLSLRSLAHDIVSERVTVSIGVATVVAGHGVTAEVLLGAADQALYRAKREGRDRVCASLPLLPLG